MSLVCGGRRPAARPGAGEGVSVTGARCSNHMKAGGMSRNIFPWGRYPLPSSSYGPGHRYSKDSNNFGAPV